LQDSQPILRHPEPTRILDHLSGRQCGKCLQAHVDPNGGPGRRKRIDVGHFQLEDHAPVAQTISLEDSHLDLCPIGQRTMLEDAYQADVLNVESPTFEADTVVIDVADRLEPTAALIS